MKARFVSDSLNEAYGQKDKVRMEDIRTKAAGDEEREIALATTQAKLIVKGEKAAARAEAAVDVFGWDHPVTKVFQQRAKELGASRGSASKGVLAPVKAPAGKGEKLEREFKRKSTLASERIRKADAEEGGGFSRGDEGMKSMGIGRFAQPEETSDKYEWSEASILPIGWVDIGSGESQYLNVYREWPDSTAELWETPEGKYRLIFTAGKPSLKIGQTRDFRHDQTWKNIGRRWKFIDYLPVKDLMELARVYNKHKFPGYTYNQVSRRESGAGTVLRVYNTPYGKVVFEGLYGMPRYGSAWAERDTIENLFADKKIRKISEAVKFERGRDPKSAIGLGMVEVELDYHNFLLDDDGNPDLEDEDTAYSLKELQDSGLEYSFEKSSWGPVLVRLKGYRDQLAPFVADYLDEPYDMVGNAFQQWDGVDEKDLWNLMGY